MLKYATPWLLCLFSIPAAAQVELNDGQIVSTGKILGPDQQLLKPYFATEHLRGADYVEWCLRWNKMQDYLAEQRAVPPRTLHGEASERLGYTQGYASSYFLARAGQYRSSTNESARSHDLMWQLGGNAGGAVMLYNPFVAP